MGEFRCNGCGGNCCTCGGCQPMTTPGGKACCSRCYQGVCRVEQAEQQAFIQQQLDHIQKPNEKLYSNGH